MINLILADASEEYLLDLQTLLLSQCGQIQTEIISDIRYLEQYFRESHALDLIIISEAYYGRLEQVGLLKDKNLSANRVFLLAKSGDKPEVLPYAVRVPRQHTSILPALVRKIFLKPTTDENAPKTRLVTVHSPLGRSGKTTVAMGLAHKLSLLGARTLFISMDRLQSCNWLLGDSRYLLDDHLDIFNPENENIADDIIPLIKRHGFFYIPPFSSPALSLQIPKETYPYMAQKLVESEQYDCIVMDASCEFSRTVSQLLRMSHNNVIIALQDANSSYKLNRTLLCLDDPFQERFSFLCNFYRPEMADARSAHLRKLIGDKLIPYNVKLDGEQISRAANDPAFAAVMDELSREMI